MSNILLNILRNPQTTIFGVIGLIGSIKTVVANPILISDPTWWTAMSVSVGLITAKDGNKTGTATGVTTAQGSNPTSINPANPPTVK